MPRSNRPKSRRAIRATDEGGSLEHLLSGWKRTETRRGREFYVQPLSADRAVKEYLCPGCGLGIEPGIPHLVIWRADGVLGDDADLAARRHWHNHCWRIG
jgi:hypothetical protein